MTIRHAASHASLAVLILVGVVTSTSNAQNLPGSPILTANTGSINDLPPGSSVKFDLKLGNNLGNGVTIDPRSVIIQVLDSNNNLIATLKYTATANGGNSPSSYDFIFYWTIPGNGQPTDYFIQYAYDTSTGGFEGGDIPIKSGNPG